MNTTMFRFTVTGLLGMLAVPLAHAQTGARVIADIPFEFNVGSKTMDAGQCQVGVENPNLILVRCDGHRAASFALTNTVSSNKVEEQGKLVFHRYGDQLFLSQIWIAGSASGRELPPSRSERRAMQTAAAQSSVVIVAKR
jgi:hypothetical protein